MSSYYFHQNYLSFIDDGASDESPPKGTTMITSNQNALLSLMSHDDLEGIKTKIHSKIK